MRSTCVLRISSLGGDKSPWRGAPSPGVSLEGRGARPELLSPRQQLILRRIVGIMQSGQPGAVTFPMSGTRSQPEQDNQRGETPGEEPAAAELIYQMNLSPDNGWP